MRRALARDFAAMVEPPSRIVVTLDARLPVDLGPWDLIRIDPENGEREFEAAVIQADYALVIAPETGGILRRAAIFLENAGVRSLGSSSSAIEITTDKDRFGRHLRGLGIPTPRGHRLGSETPSDDDLGFPLIYKPVDGAGAFETYLVDSPIALAERRRNSGGECMLQEFIEGEPLSASYLIDREGGAHLVSVGRQRIRIEAGTVRYRGGEIPYSGTVDLEPIEAAIAAVPGLRGFIGVDFIADPRTGKSTVIEINPRATTSCVGLCARLPAGLLACAWLAACEGSSARNSHLFESVAEEIAKQPTVAFGADGMIEAGGDERHEQVRDR